MRRAITALLVLSWVVPAGSSEDLLRPAERRWEGERVQILPAKNLCPKSDTPKVFQVELPGKTGVLQRVVWEEGGAKDLVIVLDGSGDKVTVGSDLNLLFLAELAAARSLVGKYVWAKGTTALLPDCALVGKGSHSNDETIPVANTDRLKIVDAVPGHLAVCYSPDQVPVVITMETDDGKRGCLITPLGFDRRFYFPNSSPAPYVFQDVTYTDDPRKELPRVSDVVWELVRKQEVAIGMSEDVARLACGRQMEVVGWVLAGDDSTNPDHIYSCAGRRFVVENGKVTRYVEQQ